MRTDDDSWDIATSVGATALGVAAMRAAETRRDDALFRDPFAEPLVSAVGLPAWDKLVRGELRDVDETIARVYSPMTSFMVARTCYFDDYFEAAAADGIRQIVILAAGLDARAYRLGWPVGTTVFELDQPKVLEFKATALAAHQPVADRCAIAVDLRHDWPAALRINGFDATAPTAWLAEGLLRYLPADAQDRLFQNVVDLSVPGSRFASNLAGDPTPESKKLDDTRAKMMAAFGIEVDVQSLWYSSEGRSDPVDWFGTHGWAASRTDPMTVLRARGRAVPGPIADEMSRHTLMTAIRPRGDSSR